MDFRKLNKENLYSVEDQGLLEMLYKSIVDMSSIQYIREEKHELAKYITVPRFEHIKSEIRYEQEKDLFKIKVPIIDERRRSHYKKSVFYKVYDRLPESEAFVTAESKLVVKPFGLVEVHYWGNQLFRMGKDTRNFNAKRAYNKVEYLYFNYDDRLFKQVSTDELEKVRFSVNKNSDFDLSNVNEDVKIYLEREQLLELSLNRLKGYSEGFHNHFDIFRQDAYNKALEGKYLRLNPNQTIKDVMSYLTRYRDFLANYLSDWLKLKLVFSTITIAEQERLEQEKDRLNGLLLEAAQCLQSLVGLLTKKTNNPLVYPWKAVDTDQDTEEGLLNVKLTAGFGQGIFSKLEAFKEPRPTHFIKAEPFKGYIEVDAANRELYPNIGEVERRRYLTDEFSSLQMEQEYKEMVLQYINEKQV